MSRIHVAFLLASLTLLGCAEPDLTLPDTEAAFDTQPITCPGRPDLTGKAADDLLALLTANSVQVIQFNPNALFQRLARLSGFVPNSPEFDWNFGGVINRSQRFERLDSSTVRIYNVAQVGGAWDWSQVFYEDYDARTYFPSVSDTTFPANLWRQAARRQVIEFNPGAAMQAEMRRDGFVPNSSEFLYSLYLPEQGREVVMPMQRAERLDDSSRFRVYGWLQGRVTCREWPNTPH
jgi:hypothetical protein